MNRRDALRRMAAAASVLGLVAEGRATPAEAEPPRLGLVSYCLEHQQRALRQKEPKVDLADPLELLEYCRRLGAGGIETSLGAGDAAHLKALRAKAEDYGMYVEAIVSLPASDADTSRFEAQMRAAAAAGARAVRTVPMPGRRYEYFDSLDKFRQFHQRGRQMLQRAVPIAEKHRVRLAVENHKTHLAAELADLLRQIGSPYLGACVDTGNNLALLEDPIEVVETLAPWAFSVHLKDHALKEYEEGFLLADVPLGQGALDLKRMVAILRKAQPEVRFSLELITRDPLKVPCLTEPYWVTVPNLPGRDLAHTLRLVRWHEAKSLPPVDSLPPQEQAAVEIANVTKSLAYARRQLRL